MGRYTVNRPDEAAMRRLLDKNPANPAGAILRLAWLQGLLREEITRLTWAQVSFLDRQIQLPDRAVPIGEEMLAYLQYMRDKWTRVSPYVVFSERFRKQMQPQAISRIARRVLDGEGQTEVRLIDLRHDYILRQLRDHDWGYVSRVSGVEIRTLQLHFSDCIEGGAAQVPGKDRREAEIDEFRLWKLLQSERDTPAGLALWLTWQMGLTGNEIIGLTWDQVAFERNALHLPDRDVPLTSSVGRMLEERLARRTADCHVLLSERAQRPIDLSRLSRMTRSALIRGGMENFTLKDLQRCAGRGSEETAVLEAVRERGMVSRSEVMELLGITKSAAYSRLRRMTEEKKLVRIGGKYYLQGTVVPPERQRQAIRDYLTQEGFAYRQDIAQVLHVQSKQCSLILKHLVDTGELVRIDQKYYLKEA